MRDCILLSNNVSFRVGNFEGKVWASTISRTPPPFGLYVGNACEYSHKSYISRKWNHWPTLCRWQFRSIFIFIPIFFLVGYAKRLFSTWVRLCCSRSSKVVHFGTNRKRVCNFLLVSHGNLGPVLHRFRDIAGFCAHPCSTLILGCSRWTTSPIANQQWNYFRSIPTYVIKVPDPGWTSQTDRRHTVRVLRSIAR